MISVTQARFVSLNENKTLRLRGRARLGSYIWPLQHVPSWGLHVEALKLPTMSKRLRFKNFTRAPKA